MASHLPGKLSSEADRTENRSVSVTEGKVESAELDLDRECGSFPNSILVDASPRLRQ
jgi:hypothetical protein